MAAVLAPNLLTATRAFIRTAKIAAGPRSSNISIAIVGGTAIINKTNHRATQDVDFYIAGTDRMAFRDELVAKGNIPGLPPEWTINHESRCGVTHMIRSPNQAPVIVKIDIIDERVTGWKLSSDTFLAQVSEQSLPWGSRNDLICTKLKSAEERLSHGNTKAKQDVDDVQQLLYKLPGVLRDDREKKHCAYCLESAVQISTWDIRQWEERLGIKIPEL